MTVVCTEMAEMTIKISYNIFSFRSSQLLNVPSLSPQMSPDGAATEGQAWGCQPASGSGEGNNFTP